MLGNLADAMIAQGLGHGRIRPEGWELLGAGSARYCYRAPDGVCYKVETWRPSQNPVEYAWYLLIKDSLRHTNVRLPEMNLFTVDDGMCVLAAEFVDFDQHEYDGIAYDLAAQTMRSIFEHWSDSQPGANSISVDGNVWVVDLGVEGWIVDPERKVDSAWFTIWDEFIGTGRTLCVEMSRGGAS